MELLDSRRLTGPNLICAAPGAVLDVAIPDAQKERVIAVWQDHARALQSALGWTGADVGVDVRVFAGGASLVLHAPIDALYVACEANESAWSRTVAECGGAAHAASAAAEVDRLRQLAEEEANPALLRLEGHAARHGLTFLSDDDEASIGTGSGSRTYAVDDLPEPDAVPTAELHDVPIVLVTGTNGKSTTVRMLAAIATAAGRTPGYSSTDGLWIGREQIDTGDYSGPGGARTVLRDRRTAVALLETARGGMLRRGLGVRRADAVAVLNVAEDHMGEYGVMVLDDLADAKFIVQKAVARGGPMVLNADDPLVVAGCGRHAPKEIVWFSLDPENPIVTAHRASGGVACVADGSSIRYGAAAEEIEVVAIPEIPATMRGRARFNVANALAAVALAFAVDLPLAAVAAGLRAFGTDATSNPGRLNVFEFGGVTAIVDFSHNAHGLRAFLEMANALPAQRRLLTLGMAGDRSDEACREFARAGWEGRPDRIILKEMERYLRGRELGETVAVMDAELRRLGARAEEIGHADSELEAVRSALAWARRGDLLLLSIQAEREEVTRLLEELAKGAWEPGDAPGPD